MAVCPVVRTCWLVGYRRLPPTVHQGSQFTGANQIMTPADQNLEPFQRIMRLYVVVFNDIPLNATGHLHDYAISLKDGIISVC